ncbi:MAG: primosomal protein N' [Gammaproteobacteria bacterium]
MTSSAQIVEVAVFCPNLEPLDYLWPDDAGFRQKPDLGIRVRVPLGSRTVVGIVVGLKHESALPVKRLRSIQEVLDPVPLLTATLSAFVLWASRYYQYPAGLAFQGIIPPTLKRGCSRKPPVRTFWVPPDTHWIDHPGRLGTASRALLIAAAQNPDGLDDRALDRIGRKRARSLAKRGLLIRRERPVEPAPPHRPAQGDRQPVEMPLNAEQQSAVRAILETTHSFQCTLLDGVTGSGKTDVYLAIARAIVDERRSALLLLPEIALTPQLTTRIEQVFGSRALVYHSERSPEERQAVWDAVRSEKVHCVIGTRSALFLPFATLGLIVVDEEHDSSFKQQDGFRYSARDLAVYRARQLRIPIVLGSATPSLESLANAKTGRYRHLCLTARAGRGQTPDWSLVDIRGQRLTGGFSDKTLVVMETHLARRGQILIYLNRRGFARSLLCPDCGWIATCEPCESPFTVHQRERRLLCHRCGLRRPVPDACPACGGTLSTRGSGTERLEATLAERFPGVGLARLDRDVIARRDRLASVLEGVRSGATRMLVGTQMLAKGHDFHGVTLVVVIDADQGLYSADFRAAEHLGQQLVQVAGRAGRGEQAGEVVLQTRHPENPLLHDLFGGSYASFAEHLLEERRQAGWPPYAKLALLIAESTDSEAAWTVLRAIKRDLEPATGHRLDTFGPAPALHPKQAGRWRIQLLLRASSRSGLQAGCARIFERHKPHSKKVRLTLDIDPYSLD